MTNFDYHNNVIMFLKAEIERIMLDGMEVEDNHCVLRFLFQRLRSMLDGYNSVKGENYATLRNDYDEFMGRPHIIRAIRYIGYEYEPITYLSKYALYVAWSNHYKIYAPDANPY